MKTSIRYFIIALIMTTAVSIVKAEKPGEKAELINLVEFNCRFYSIPEPEVDEPDLDNYIGSKLARVQWVVTPEVIACFIKPEAEIDDLTFDTAAVFNQIAEESIVK